jgi:23S rRNA pseudouridine2605 synthase
MILTNDGEMAERLMHPRYGFERVYHVRVEGIMNDSALRKIEEGVRLEDGMIRGRARFISRDEDSCWVEISVSEGRNRVVRRLMDKLRHPVMKLRRVSYGPFKLGNLEIGNIRKLTDKEYYTFRERVMTYTPGSNQKPKFKTKPSRADR